MEERREASLPSTACLVGGVTRFQSREGQPATGVAHGGGRDQGRQTQIRQGAQKRPTGQAGSTGQGVEQGGLKGIGVKVQGLPCDRLPSLPYAARCF